MPFIILIAILIFAAVMSRIQYNAKKRFKQNIIESGFTATKSAGSLCVDENNKKWWINREIGTPIFHDYNEILDFELVIDGEKLKTKGGFTRAIAGGLLFGGIGALIGAGTAKKQSTITQMYINVILKGGNLERIPFITVETKVGSLSYNAIKETAEQAEAILTNMVYETDMFMNETVVSASHITPQIETTTYTDDIAVNVNTNSNIKGIENNTIPEEVNAQFIKRHDARNSLYNLDHSNINFHSGIKEDGGYDFTVLTDDERNYIEEKLSEAERKYSEPYAAIGLSFVSATTVYKPGYILPQIVILRYSDSENPLDMLAVAIAYSKKGAYFRKQAIEYFEKYYTNPVPAKIPNADYALFDERNLKLTLADLYEKEYEFEKAILTLRNYYKTIGKKDEVIVDRIGQILVKIDVNKAVDYYETAISRYSDSYTIQSSYITALEKQQKGYVYRPRKSKPKESDLLINEQIEALAKQFV